MHLVRSISAIPQSGRPVVLATGCFDGVHLGHQQVIRTAVDRAAAQDGEAWIFTFNPHPAKILSPESAPPLISAEPCRMRQFAALGVEGVIEIPFDHRYAHIEPTDFLQTLHASLPALCCIVCGADWSFGYKALGGVPMLESIGTRYGIETAAVSPVRFEGEKISSTSIRRLVAGGHVDKAAQLLGRPFSIFGPVIAGRGVGRELGFPTANIRPVNELMPAPGVYAATGGIFSTTVPPAQAGAVFIGERMTFGDPSPTVELHVLDPAGDCDLYGKQMELCLIKKIRDVRKFESRDALREQIRLDIDTIRTLNRPPAAAS